jgi:hypothetical protein
LDLGGRLGWPENHEDDKPDRIENFPQLNPIIPFNNAVMEAYWLILSSPFGTIKLNENIESDRHSLETSNDILSSDTCEMIVTLLKGEIYEGCVRVMTTRNLLVEGLGYQDPKDLDDTFCCTPASVQSTTTTID